MTNPKTSSVAALADELWNRTPKNIVFGSFPFVLHGWIFFNGGGANSSGAHSSGVILQKMKMLFSKNTETHTHAYINQHIASNKKIKTARGSTSTPEISPVSVLVPGLRGSERASPRPRASERDPGLERASEPRILILSQDEKQNS